MAKATTVLSTQKFINVAQIKNGIIVTKTGLLRHVIHVQPLNFALKSEEDQNIIVGQYQNFINSLNFPLQIVIHSRRLDVGPYLATLKAKSGNAINDLLRMHMQEYISFVASLTELTNIMDKEFYAVVGYDPQRLSKSGLMSGLFGHKEQSKINFSDTEWKKYLQELGQRVDLVVGGLTAIGLKCEPFDTQKSIELLYGVFNPEEATTEKLAPSDSLQAEVISKEKIIPPDLTSGKTPVNNTAGVLDEVESTNSSPGEITTTPAPEPAIATPEPAATQPTDASPPPTATTPPESTTPSDPTAPPQEVGQP